MLFYLIWMVPPILFAMWAQYRVKRAFSKYSKIGNASDMTGAQAAARMLEGQGLRIVSSAEEAKMTENAVAITSVRGFLSDHYDPGAKVLRLSPDVYGGRSLASVGIACHEAGHALQDAQGYAALSLRSQLVPIVKFGSMGAFPIIFIGLLISSLELAVLGLILFATVSVFQFVTLPVEFNASTRAKRALEDMRIIQGPAEREGVATVLDAAALTYVAALVSSIMTLLYYAMLVSGIARN